MSWKSVQFVFSWSSDELYLSYINYTKRIYFHNVFYIVILS